MKRMIVLLLALVSLSSSPLENAPSRYKELALSDGEIELAARAVRAETDGENFLIKACVTAMIFNRLNDVLMPNDMRAVVFEKGAFTRATRDEIEKEVSPDELEEYVVLARLVYEYGIDPACGALFCFEGEDDLPPGYRITLSVDGFVFAARY